MSLIMEYADGGSLHDLLHKQKLELLHNRIVSYACDVASGLAYLHNRHIIHRDVTSANVLVTLNCNIKEQLVNSLQLFEGRTIAKIADFGQSRFLNEKSLAKTVTGTPYFMAPEVLSEELYDYSADVYSFGILLHEMCTNKTPPIFFDERKRMAYIKESVSKPELLEFCELTMKCCQTDPKLRPTIQECIDTLKKME